MRSLNLPSRVLTYNLSHSACVASSKTRYEDVRKDASTSSGGLVKASIHSHRSLDQILQHKADQLMEGLRLGGMNSTLFLIPVPISLPTNSYYLRSLHLQVCCEKNHCPEPTSDSLRLGLHKLCTYQLSPNSTDLRLYTYQIRFSTFRTTRPSTRMKSYTVISLRTSCAEPQFTHQIPNRKFGMAISSTTSSLATKRKRLDHAIGYTSSWMKALQRCLRRILRRGRGLDGSGSMVVDLPERQMYNFMRRVRPMI